SRRGLKHEIGCDQLVDRVRETRATSLAQDAVAEALADDGRELDALFRRRRKPVDPCRDDGVKCRGDLERGRALAQLPLALVVLRDGARIDERADRLLDAERIAPG